MNAIQWTDQDLPPVAPGVFDFGETDGAPYLCGGRCRTCGRHAFPRPATCIHCQGDMEPVSLGRNGVIYGHTIIRTRPPYGLPRPYGVALIDLEDAPLRVFCLLDPACLDDFAIGSPVQLAVAPLGHDGQNQPCLRPIFQLRS